MAITNPFSITYGSRQVGASTSYQLDGPYTLEKSQEAMRVGFDVIVVGSSTANLQSLCDTLETDFRKRDLDLTISLDGNDWDYVRGENVLNTSSTIVKAGDPITDRGLSRRYSVLIEAELPSSDTSGLRDLEVLVDYERSRQKVVTMRGAYTAYGNSGSGTNAYALYAANFDTEATTLLTFIDSGATWELVDESYTVDRNKNSGSVFPHVCTFTRQYAELVSNQASGTLDLAQVRDHRVVFTDTSQHPGDSAKDINRLRRVIGTYDSAVDIDQTTDLESIYSSYVKPYLIQAFKSEFSPNVFCVESMRYSFDETSNNISVEFQFLYQGAGGSKVVEASHSITYRENRTIDYTYIHSGDELSAVADPGFLNTERIINRTVIFLGAVNPVFRISNIGSGSVGETGKGKPPNGQKLNNNYEQMIENFFGLTSNGFGYSGRRGGKGSAGGGAGGGNGGSDSKVNSSGWNIISNTSNATPQYIGDPQFGEQILVTTLTETIVERYNKEPRVKSGGGVTR